MALTYGELTETPLGPISFYAGENGLKRLAFISLNKLKQKENLQVQNPSLVGLDTIGTLLTELNAYLYGMSKNFTIKFDWDVISSFQRDVLVFTNEIPYGEVRTYGEIARGLGKPSAARAVGMALGSNPMPILIPCHRVIGAGGRLRGYIGGIQSKVFLLRLEGHKIRNDKLINNSIDAY